MLHSQQIGITGLGEIGGRVATVAHAFGMEVVAWSPNTTPERAASKRAAAVSFNELIMTSHITTTHLVLSPMTKNLLGTAQFAAIRTDAIFVNTARAGLTDEAALLTALQAGRPAMAAPDVFSVEPLPASHPFITLPNVVLTPHIGFVCEPVFRKFYGDVVEALAAWLDDKPLPRVLAP